MQTPSNVPLEISPRDLSKPFSLRVSPPCFGQSVSELHTPAGVTLSDITTVPCRHSSKQEDGSAEGFDALANDVVVVDLDEISAAVR